MKYIVTSYLDNPIEADTPEEAAKIAERYLLTYAARDYAVTPAGGGTVFIRILKGEAKRIA
jgi:hypothetical protein